MFNTDSEQKHHVCFFPETKPMTPRLNDLSTLAQHFVRLPCAERGGRCQRWECGKANSKIYCSNPKKIDMSNFTKIVIDYCSIMF